MPLLKSAVQSIGVIIVVALLAFAIHFFAGEASPLALTKTYSNPAFGFMLKMPADFFAYPPCATPVRNETGAPLAQAIVLQNKSGAAMQIVVSRQESNSILALDDLSRAMPIEIAPSVIGLTYTESEHPSFGNATEIVLFAYRGNLY
jgi:hypothetical protein